MQKGLTLILVILAVAIGGYFLYQQQTKSTPATPPAQTATQPSPASNETTNWKTYTSKCGFNIKYPTEWQGKDYFIKSSESSCFYLTAPDYKQGLDSREGFFVSIERASIGSKLHSVTLTSLEDFIKANESIVQPSIQIKNKQNKTINQFSGIQFDPLGMESLSEFIFLHNNYIYIIDWPNKYNGNYKNNFDQILSTFKFTDSQTSQIFSTEGQNCGRNAGAAGDAQCESGLICQYKNAQEEKDGIGTCIRK